MPVHDALVGTAELDDGDDAFEEELLLSRLYQHLRQRGERHTHEVGVGGGTEVVSG